MHMFYYVSENCEVLHIITYNWYDLNDKNLCIIVRIMQFQLQLVGTKYLPIGTYMPVQVCNNAVRCSDSL